MLVFSAIDEFLVQCLKFKFFISLVTFYNGRNRNPVFSGFEQFLAVVGFCKVEVVAGGGGVRRA